MQKPLLHSAVALVFVLTGLVSNPAFAVAQEGHEEEAAAAGHEAAGEHQEHAEHAEHAEHEKNEIAVFVGTTDRLKFGDDEVGFTVGVEYAREFGERSGVSFGVEFAGGKIERDWVTFLVFSYQPFDGWARPLSLYLGPGIEVASVDERLLEEDEGGGEEVEPVATDENSAEDARETEADMLIRMGLGWPFHAGRFSITPNVNFDLVGEHWTLLAGVTVGFGF